MNYSSITCGPSGLKFCTFLFIIRNSSTFSLFSFSISLHDQEHGSYLWTTLYLQKKSLEFRIIKLKTQKKEKFIMNVVS
jgi:hypothetical protein